MKKEILFVMILMLAIAVMAAPIVLNSLTNVEIPAKQDSIPIREYEGNLTCDCNGQKEINCGYVSEQILDENDLASATISICNGTAAINILLDDKLIKQNDFGMISNDEDKLNEDACIKSSGIWDKGVCNEEPGGGEWIEK